MIPKRYTNKELYQLYTTQGSYFPSYFMIFRSMAFSSVYISYWVDPQNSPTGKYMLYRKDGPAVIFTNGQTEWYLGDNLSVQSIFQDGTCACWTNSRQSCIHSYLGQSGIITVNGE